MKSILALLAIACLLALAGCDSDDDGHLRTQLDAAREAAEDAQQRVMELEAALETAGHTADEHIADLTTQLEAAQADVTRLEMELAAAADANAMEVADLTAQLAAVHAELDVVEAILEAIRMGMSLYEVTVTNNLGEKLAPIVVTHAANDSLLFTPDNYVTEAAEHQILTGWPCMVVDAIGVQAAASNHPTRPRCVEENKVTVAAGQSSDPIMFDGDAAALRIIAMVAPSMYKDHYVSAVVDAPLEGSVTVPLSRFDIGHDEGTMSIRLVAENAGTVTITRLGEAMADDTVMEMATYVVEVTNELSESGELLAPIVAARINDEHYLFDGTYVTEAAKRQILTGNPDRVIESIGMDDAVAFHGHAGPPGVLLEPGNSVLELFDTGATALRILAMVAPTEVPDNYVSAVVNVAPLADWESVMAPLSRFEIGDDEGTMDITRIDDDMTVGTVTITRLPMAIPPPADMTAFHDRVAGLTAEFLYAAEGEEATDFYNVLFTGHGRQVSTDSTTEGEFPGNYSYSAEGDAGVLFITWDPDNNPDEFHLVMEMRFTSEDEGTFRSIYNEGGVEVFVGIGTFSLVHGEQPVN